MRHGLRILAATALLLAPTVAAAGQFDRDAWIAGAAYYPDPDIAVKVDYVWQRSLSSVITAPNGFNIGIGWWF